MGLFKRLTGQQEHEAEEIACPRCGVLVPINALNCTVCGWDPREKYEGPVISRTPGGSGAA